MTNSGETSTGKKVRMPRKERKSTMPMVKQDAQRILEEFLQMTQKSLSSTTPMSPLYQKVSKIDLVEGKPLSHQGTDNHKSSEELLLDTDNVARKKVARMKTWSSGSRYETKVGNWVNDVLQDKYPNASPLETDTEEKLTNRDSKPGSESSSDDDNERITSKNRCKRTFIRRIKEKLKNIKRKQNNESRTKKMKLGLNQQAEEKRSGLDKEIDIHISSCTNQAVTPFQPLKHLQHSGEFPMKNTVEHLMMETDDDAGKMKKKRSFNKFRKALSLNRSDSESKASVKRKSQSLTPGNSVQVQGYKSTIKTSEIMDPGMSSSVPDKRKLHLPLHKVYNPDPPSDQFSKWDSAYTTHNIGASSQRMHEKMDQKESSYDDLDGLDVLGDLSNQRPDVPFNLKSKEEKEELYDMVAKKLAAIADDYFSISESERSDGDSSPFNSFQGEGAVGGHLERGMEKQLTFPTRSESDKLEKDIADRLLYLTKSHQIPVEAVKFLTDITYSNFKNIMTKCVGNEVGWDQLAMVFFFSKTTLQLVGVGKKVATNIKEITLRYFEDKFATWVVDQGGWDSMFEKESEVD